MRERLAKAFAVVLTLAVTGLSALFARQQNLPRGPEAPSALSREDAPVVPAAPPDPATRAVARAAFVDRGCAGCHRLEGVGNPRDPLDGVGARRPVEEIRAFIVAEPAVRGSLTRSVVRTKEGYRDLPSRELEALVSLLAASGDEPPS